MPSVTQGLAECKTLLARIAAKEKGIQSYLARQAIVIDPHAGETHNELTGSAAFVAKELQSVHDMRIRYVDIRSAVHKQNDLTWINLTLPGGTRISKTVTGWLSWRKDLSAGEIQSLKTYRTLCDQARRESTRRDGKVVTQGQGAPSENDIVFHIDETWLAQKLDDLEYILGTLDGELSQVNATTNIEY